MQDVLVIVIDIIRVCVIDDSFRLKYFLLCLVFVVCIPIPLWRQPRDHRKKHIYKIWK